MDAEGTERALVIPNYGVPDPALAFSFNELCVEAAATDDRIVAALWVSCRPADAERTAAALALAGEPGVRALKLSFLLGGRVTDQDCKPGLDLIFAAAKRFGLVVHVHTSPGAASDITEIATLIEWYGDEVDIHLVHFGGGMSGHIRLVGSLFFDWVAAGKRVYTDLSWAIGFAPRWLFGEIDRRGFGQDRILFASDEPWGDHTGELAKLGAAVNGSELSDLIFRDTFHKLYG
jgi:predicted TIM-barrel fold metal-dependent hydrolase